MELVELELPKIRPGRVPGAGHFLFVFELAEILVEISSANEFLGAVTI